MTLYVGIVVHFLSRCVCSWPAVTSFQNFQSFPCRLVQGASVELYLAISEFHMSIRKSKRADVAIHKLRAKEYFHADLISSQK